MQHECNWVCPTCLHYDLAAPMVPTTCAGRCFCGLVTR